MEAALIPSDPQASHPTYAALSLPGAWDLTTGSPRVVIAIVDIVDDPMACSWNRPRGPTSSRLDLGGPVYRLGVAVLAANSVLGSVSTRSKPTAVVR